MIDLNWIMFILTTVFGVALGIQLAISFAELIDTVWDLDYQIDKIVNYKWYKIRKREEILKE